MAPPLPPPRQVLAVGRNYAEHASELGHAVQDKAPLLFWKPIGSMISTGGVCALPRWPEGPTRIDWEGEIVLILGRDLGPGTPPLPADPWHAVYGVAAGLDSTDRDLQKLEPQWVRAKGFPGACALGVAMGRPADPEDLRVETWRNGERVQLGHTSQLLFPIRDLLVYLHGFCRLSMGDAIFTGTPSGVGKLTPGDAMRVVVGVGREGGAQATLDVKIEEGPVVAKFERRTWPKPG
jgi:2-keto-4-pentenoate hydratase/2-oxohepta-3-ene-1,7-dioic acid hydratase in catechol pathway